MSIYDLDCEYEKAPDEIISSTADLLAAMSEYLVSAERNANLPDAILDKVIGFGGDEVLYLLMEEKVRFYLKICRRVEVAYLLSRERAVLIRNLVKRYNSALLQRGYTEGYLRALQGLPTDDTSIQPDGWNSWFRYAEQGNVECLQELMRLHSRSKTPFTVMLNNDSLQHSFADVTALMIAAMLNYSDVCRLLLSEEACLMCTGKTTALMIAAWCGNLEAGRVLVEREKNMLKSRNWTALMEAAHNNRLDLVELLAPHEGGQKNSSGWTAMMIGAVRGHLDVVKALVHHEKGLQNKKGHTAKMIAKQRRHNDITDFLEDYE